MSGFSGADVAQLRQLAARMNTQSAKLDEIVNSSNVALMLAEWTGNDIDAIRNNWRRGSLPTLKNLATALREASIALERNAKEQEQVSGGASPGWADNIIESIRRSIGDLFGRILGPFLPHEPNMPHAQPDPHTPGDNPQDDQPERPVPPVERPPGPGSTTGALPGGAYDGYLAWTQQTRKFVPDDDGGHWEDGYGNWERNCTSWVDYRRAHLDPPLAMATANGGNVAHSLGGSATTPPSLGAAVSYYPPDSPKAGHVMVVEEIRSTNPPSVRVSEDNYAGGFRDTRVWTQQSDGRWSDGPGRASYALEFSPPGK